MIIETGHNFAHNAILSATSLNPITLVIADRHTLFREGLKNLLARESDIQVIGEASTGREALDLCIERNPTILVLDFAMPILDAFEVTHEIQKMEMDIQVIVIAGNLEVRDLALLISLGTKGFLCKQDDYQALSQGIREVYGGKIYFSNVFSQCLDEYGYKEKLSLPKIRKNWKGLTMRERETLKLIAVGKSNKQMASQLEISIKTVEKHREKLMNKLDIHDTAGLVRYSLRSGLL